jgi:hypothetical protein
LADALCGSHGTSLPLCSCAGNPSSAGKNNSPPFKTPSSGSHLPATSMDAPCFLLRAAAGSPCSASCHGVQVFCAAVPVQKKNSSHEIPSVSLALTRFAQRLRVVVETRGEKTLAAIAVFIFLFCAFKNC